MSTQKRNGRYVVRWREGDSHRAMTFATRREAEQFDRTMKETQRQARQAKRAAEALERARRMA